LQATTYAISQDREEAVEFFMQCLLKVVHQKIDQHREWQGALAGKCSVGSTVTGNESALFGKIADG